MFDGGVPEQFHQFIASSRTTTSIPLPLSFPLHGPTPQHNFSTFDPFPSHHHQHQTLQLQASHLLPQLHHKPEEDQKEVNNSLLSTSLEMERGRSVLGRFDPWSNEEVLALLRIRSSMENWLPDFTWEHVSRKLAELGFRRSGEMCKEKFEEESRHLDSVSYSKNYRFFSELEELCHGENSQVLAEKNQNVNKLPTEEVEVDKFGQISLEEDSRNETMLGKSNPSQENEQKRRNRKRKRRRKFEMFKSFCEEIVKKMMAHQEELHNKIIEDMVKRDEEKIAREEVWKKQEMERINKEIETRAQEQAIAGDRQTKLIEFLKKLTSNPPPDHEKVLELSKGSSSSTSRSSIQRQNPNSTFQPSNQNKLEAATVSTGVTSCQNTSSFVTQNNSPNRSTSPTETPAPEIPSSNLTQNPIHTQTTTLPPTPAPSSPHKTTQSPNLGQNEREDVGKRWPRDEVLALINLRCSFNNGGGGGGGEEKEGAKGPLWERISLGMMEMGYKRSAKRCKEKWENINKYFRKTKDANKKRSLDSRTCPYFHQLSSLYSQGTLVAPLDGPEKQSNAPEKYSAIPETLV
ncbi:hypothetical protein U1Q18_015273 [Sarracenia purpurea var. burkii]